jgi:hypothetical protein
MMTAAATHNFVCRATINPRLQILYESYSMLSNIDTSTQIWHEKIVGKVISKVTDMYRADGIPQIFTNKKLELAS